jgi:hypothetical protein
LTPPLSDDLKATVHTDAVEPMVKRRTEFEPRKIVVGREKGVLHYILGFGVSVAQDVTTGLIKARSKFSVEIGLRQGIAPEQAFH